MRSSSAGQRVELHCEDENGKMKKVPKEDLQAIRFSCHWSDGCHFEFLGGSLRAGGQDESTGLCPQCEPVLTHQSVGLEMPPARA